MTPMMKSVACEVEREAAVAGTERLKITTPGLDFVKDRIFPLGMETARYMAGPRAINFAHDHNNLPVARTVRLEKSASGIVSEFVWLEGDPQAALVRNAYRQGLLAASVEFIVGNGKRNEHGGYDFDRSELTGVALTANPANPECVRLMKALSAPRPVAALRRTAEAERDEVLDVTGFTEDELTRLAAGTGRHRSEPFGDPYRRDHEITDVSREDLRTSVQGVVRVALAAAVRAETAKALNRARGRVD
jgi:hypothetical protein